MKFAVKAVPISRKTRKRTGKARITVIDTERNQLFANLEEPLEIEQAFENHWNNLNPESTEIVKVVDVRRLK